MGTPRGPGVRRYLDPMQKRYAVAISLNPAEDDALARIAKARGLMSKSQAVQALILEADSKLKETKHG